MKRTLLCIAIACMAICCDSIQAQSYYSTLPSSYSVLPKQPPSFDTFVNKPGITLSQLADSLRTMIDPSDTEEGGAMDEWRTFKKFWEIRVGANDSSGHNMFRKYYSGLRMTILAGRGGCGTGGYQGAWEVIGPDNLPNQTVGRVDAVWADTASDSNYILAGTPGGLFKTTDGGANWVCITDNAPLAAGIWGISCITVNPRNKNTIYLGTWNNTTNARGGAGILLSYDGGNTWQQEFITMGGTLTFEDSIQDVPHVFITQDSTLLYAFMGSKVYVTPTNPSLYGWTDITPAAAAPDCGWADLQFDPANQNHFFISSTGNTGRTAIWEATDAYGSGGWNDITNGFYDASLGGYYTYPTGWSQMNMSIPGNDTLYFVAMDSFTSCDAGPHICPKVGLYKYNMTGSLHSITKIKDDLPYDRNPNSSHFKIVVSPLNPNNMYYATDKAYQSYDRGNNFYPIGEYGGSPTHGDIRDIYLEKSTNTSHGVSDRLFLASDGGVAKKPSGVDVATSGSSTTRDISGKGLTCGTFWSFATSEDGGQGIGGMMHDGTTSYEPALSTKWENLGTSDAWGCAVNNANPPTGYSWKTYDQLGATGYAFGRQMGAIGSFTTPYDADFQTIGVGSPIETDVYGTIYNLQNNLYRKLPTDPSFVNSASIGLSGWGFPSASGVYGAFIALNRHNPDFEGYVLYNSNFAPSGQYLYYRNNSTYGPTAISTSMPPGTSFYGNVVGMLVTDPANTENVWATVGGIVDSNYSEGTRNRVKYSPNHGTTWIDISNGLPQRIPASKIAYDEATHRLYCATEAGVYTYDFTAYTPGYFVNTEGRYENTSVSWTCFSKGLIGGHDFPNGMVTDLRINHCQGKLYAAIFGRSIWSTDLIPPDSTTTPPVTDIIGVSTTWTTDHFISGGILVQHGNTLTISGCTVHMPKNGRIDVELGAHLIVDNATITNDCPQCFWEGIEAYGNASLPQSPSSNQGWVTIKNGSIIENARTGVKNYQIEDTGLAAGAIIQATNSSFINNHVSADFQIYQNWIDCCTLIPDLSYFYHCNFLLDNNYHGDATLYASPYQVKLLGVSGISFAGSQFLNQDMNLVSKGVGDAIHAFNSGFIVSSRYSGHPSVYYDPRFCGFTNGIFVAGTMDYPPMVSISGASFDSVSVGVYVSALNNVSTTGCKFKIGHGNPTYDASLGGGFSGCGQNIGIFSQNAQMFRMELNTFEGSPIPAFDWYNYGTVVVNSETGINEIFRNTFDSLSIGACSVGDNTNDVFGATNGLHISCNTFHNNSYDIDIVSDGTTSAFEGVAYKQESGGVSAGNTFSSSTMNLVCSAKPVLYYAVGPYGGSQWPVITKVSPAPAAFVTGAISTNGCISSSDILAGPPVVTGGTGGIVMSTLRLKKGSFLSNQSIYLSTLATYNGIMDFGNTDSLVHVVDTSSSTTAIYSALSLGSPYISQTVLKEVGNIMALPYSSMMSILMMNPDDLRDGNFLAYLDSDYSFTTADMDTLVSRGNATTDRTSLEQAIGTAQMTMSDDAHQIMMSLTTATDTNVSVADTTGMGICMDSTSVYYLLDSNTRYVGIDSVDAWLQHIGGLWTDYARVGFYSWRGKTTIADSIFTSISSLIPAGDSTDSTEYADYTPLWHAIKEAETAGRSVYSLDSTEIASLDTSSIPLITHSTARQSVRNLTVMESTVGITSFPCMTARTGMTVGGIARHSHGSVQPVIPPITNVNGNGTNQFSAFPNPTSGVVTFTYNVQNGSNDIRIVITNVIGEKIAEIQTSSTVGSSYWDSRTVSPGIYIYTASDGKGIVSKGKLVVVK